MSVQRPPAGSIPTSPGSYQFKDDLGRVIYVGKARNLKNRVSNYTRAWGHTARIATMISLTANMEFVTTSTDAEALLLEANLIKKLKPRFNVILRDDKSFPYILIARDHDVAQLVKHRGARNRKGSYFGPFASAGAVNRAINTLQKAFLLRTCTDSTYANRTRPCLLYQIKRCAAPCVNYIEPQAYYELAKEAEAFLNGKSQVVKSELAKQMEEAAESLDFERAASFRDRIQAMSFVTQTQGINPQGVEEADVFSSEGIACVSIRVPGAGSYNDPVKFIRPKRKLIWTVLPGSTQPERVYIKVGNTGRLAPAEGWLAGKMNYRIYDARLL